MRSMTDWISASVASAFITIIISCFSWGLCTLYERRPAAALGPKAPMSVAVLRAPAERLAKSPGAVGEVGVAEAPRRGVKRQVSGAIGHRGRRIVAGRTSAGKRVIRAERPHVALRIACGELARAVVGVLQLARDLGPGGLRAVVRRVGVGDDHVGRVVTRLELRIAYTGRAEHHHATPRGELGVVDGAAVLVDRLALEAERALEEV